MKRTTLWVTLAATGVQLAALGLCAWAMQNSRNGSRALAKPRADDALRLAAGVLPIDVVVVPEPALAVEPAVVEAPIAPLALEPVVAVASAVVDEPPEALAPTSALAGEPPLEHPGEPVAAEAWAPEASAPEAAAAQPLAADSVVIPPEAPEPAAETAPAVEPLDTVADIWADPATLPEFWSASGSQATALPDSEAAALPPVSVATATPTVSEVTATSPGIASSADAVASPAPSPRYAPSRAIPRFITNFADAQTQIVVAEEGDPPVVFGLFADGNVRCVDVDNGCYGGKAEGPRSRMREVAGSRAFTVHLEPADDGSFTASFIGGLHDAQSMTLLPVGAADRA